MNLLKTKYNLVYFTVDKYCPSTDVWDVYRKSNDKKLGVIKWDSSFRTNTFYIDKGSLTMTLMNEISSFMKKINNYHKNDEIPLIDYHYAPN